MLTSPSRLTRLVRRTAEQRFGNGEIAGELAPLLFLQPLRHAAADILLNIGGISAEHSRQAGEILPALGAQTFKAMRGSSNIYLPLRIGKCLDK